MKFIDPCLRSVVYKYLSACFRYPEEPQLNELRGGGRCEAVLEALSAISADGGRPLPAISGLFRSLDSASLADLQTEYVRLFDYRPACPLFESAHVDSHRGNPALIMVSIERFYNMFGLDVSPLFKDPSDHIVLELEFMHFLSFKEGESLERADGEAEKYRRGQYRFSEDHILKWVPGLGERITEKAGCDFYRNLGEWMKHFVLQDGEYCRRQCSDLNG